MKIYNRDGQALTAEEIVEAYSAKRLAIPPAGRVSAVAQSENITNGVSASYNTLKDEAATRSGGLWYSGATGIATSYPNGGYPERLLAGFPNVEGPWLYVPKVFNGTIPPSPVVVKVINVSGSTVEYPSGTGPDVGYDIDKDLSKFFNTTNYPRFIYANSLSRESAGSLTKVFFPSGGGLDTVNGDVGNFAYQESDDTLWVLADVTSGGFGVWTLYQTGYNASTGLMAPGYYISSARGVAIGSEVGTLKMFHTNIAANGRILGPVVASNFPLGQYRTLWHAGYRATGTWNSAGSTVSDGGAGVIIWKGITYTPDPPAGIPLSIYRSVSAIKSDADAWAADAVGFATNLIPSVGNSASFQLGQYLESYADDVCGIRDGTVITVVPIVKKVTSKYTGAEIGYMPAGMTVNFPANVAESSVCLGFAKMVYRVEVGGFVTQSWTTLDAPVTIGPCVADIAFLVTDLTTRCPPPEEGELDFRPDLIGQATGQTKAMRYAGTPYGFPYLGQLIDTYRGAKEVITGIPRSMTPWEPPI